MKVFCCFFSKKQAFASLISVLPIWAVTKKQPKSFRLLVYWGATRRGTWVMLQQAIPNIFVKDFQKALAYYTGALGFRPLFVYGDTPFYAHVARDDAILALRHVTRPVIDHTAGEALLSAFIEVSDVTALHTSLSAAGAQIWQLPRDEPWAMRSLIVADPDGNLICFASNLAPRQANP